MTHEATLKEGTKSVPDPKDQALTTFEEDITFVYGATRDLTLSVTLPILERRLRFEGSAGERWTMRANRSADLPLAGAYRPYGRDQMQSCSCSQGQGMGCFRE